MRFLLAIVVMLFLGGMYLAYLGVQKEQAAEREWMDYSAAHHCRVVRPRTFPDGRVTWACEGFEVMH